MASRIVSRYVTAILRAPPTVPPSLLRPHPRLPRTLLPVAHRLAHTIPKPAPRAAVPAQDDASSSSPADATTRRKQLEPHYQLTFTCVPCTHRSTHVVSKQGYHRGSVLITCPSCRNRHVISDNLNIFGDRQITVEELLREKGQLVKRGTIGEDGDIEFWEDTLSDAPIVGEASAASAQGEREKDEAQRLREAIDPSSQTADPTQSVSALPGSTATRPTVQGVSHQDATPSTRRQYSTQFKTPIFLKRNVAPLGPVPRWVDSETTILRSANGSHSRRIRRNPRNKLEANDPIALLRAALAEEEDDGPRKGAHMDALETELDAELEEEKHLEKPLEKSQVELVRRIPATVGGPVVRSVMSEVRFNGPRFIDTKNDKSVSIQLRPGYVLSRRPPGGVLDKELQVPVPPNASRNLSREHGFFRPTGVRPGSES
ncbi:DNL zinc finger-domain-containing protein [Xylaria sp. FL1777]|nr:DNL zinc finger-domain-containing protein [Xylaria sp. FL1777]